MKTTQELIEEASQLIDLAQQIQDESHPMEKRQKILINDLIDSFQ